MRLKSLIVVAACCIAGSVHSVRAQTAASSQPLVPIPTRTYIGFNPIGLPADIGTAEFETAIANGFTLGGVGSYIDVDDIRFTTFELKGRYYPGGVVLRGTSVGATLGYTHFSNLVDGIQGQVREDLNAPTLGIIVDHNWIYGRDQHFLVGTGIGAKRVIASQSERDRADMPRAIFTVRLILGFAF
jgi:hypothetical protein